MEKLIQSKSFKILLALAGATMLGFAIYDKIVTIKKHKLEIEKLQNQKV